MWLRQRSVGSVSLAPPRLDIGATSAAIGGQLPSREDIGDRTNRLCRGSRAIYAWSGTPTRGKAVVLAP